MQKQWFTTSIQIIFFFPCSIQRYRFVKSWKNFSATTDRMHAEQFGGQQERQQRKISGWNLIVYCSATVQVQSATQNKGFKILRPKQELA
jgi:hypothetical protein